MSIVSNTPLQVRNSRYEELKHYVPADVSGIVEGYLVRRQVSLIFLRIENTLTTKTVADIDKTAVQRFATLVQEAERNADIGIVFINSCADHRPVSVLRERIFADYSFSAHIIDSLSLNTFQSLEQGIGQLQIGENNHSSPAFLPLPAQENDVLETWLSAHSKKLQVKNFIIINSQGARQITQGFPYNHIDMREPLFSETTRVDALAKLQNKLISLVTTWNQILLPLGLVKNDDRVYQLAHIAQSEKIALNDRSEKAAFGYSLACHFADNVWTYVKSNPSVLDPQVLEVLICIAGCDHKEFLHEVPVQPGAWSLGKQSPILRVLNACLKQITTHTTATQLSLQLHQTAFEMYKKQLLKLAGNLETITQVLTGLLYTMNHKEMSEKDQLDVLQMICIKSRYHEKEQLLCCYAQLNHVKERCKNEILKALSQIYYQKDTTDYTLRIIRPRIESCLSPDLIAALRALER